MRHLIKFIDTESGKVAAQGCGELFSGSGVSISQGEESSAGGWWGGLPNNVNALITLNCMLKNGEDGRAPG